MYKLSYDEKSITAWKMSVFGVILVHIFPHSDWIWRDMKYLSVFSPNAGKYNFKYGHFLRSSYCVRALFFSVKTNSFKYSEFLLPFGLLFRYAKQWNLFIESLMKARLLDSTFESFSRDRPTCGRKINNVWIQSLA